MPMVRAMRLLNAVEAGTTSGAQLETLLTADPGRLAEWNVLIGMRGQCQRIFASSTATTALIASSAALNALVTSRNGMRNTANDPQAMAAVAASSTAMAAVAASSTAMAAVAASSTAMAAVAASSTAMEAIYASTSAIAAIMPTAWGVYAPHASRLTLSGSNVTQWSDASANARNFVQATGGQQPLFNATSVLNGYNTLNFVRANSNVLTTPTTHAMPADVTAYIVRRKTTDSTYMGLIGTNSTDNVGAIADSDTAGSICIDHSANPSSYKMAIGTVNNTWELIRVRNTGTTTWAKKNNGSEASTGANALNGTVTLSIGRMNDADANGDMYFNGQIAEIIILSKNATDGDAEGDRITNLLKTKYALW